MGMPPLSGAFTLEDSLDDPHAIVLPWLNGVAPAGDGPSLREGPSPLVATSHVPPLETNGIGGRKLG
jgi:hypothetical protein